MRSRVFISVVFSLLFAVPVLAESAASAFKAGEHAEKKNDYDTAYQAYKKAHDTSPSDPKYMAAYLRMRFYASSQHIHAGQTLRDQRKEEEAPTEFRLASQIAPTTFQAQGPIPKALHPLPNYI